MRIGRAHTVRPYRQEEIKMPYEFPERLTQFADEDSRRLWECLWKLVERLNLNDEALTQTITQLSRSVKGTIKESAESAVYNGEVL